MVRRMISKKLMWFSLYLVLIYCCNNQGPVADAEVVIDSSGTQNGGLSDSESSQGSLDENSNADSQDITPQIVMRKLRDPTDIFYDDENYYGFGPNENGNFRDATSAHSGSINPASSQSSPLPIWHTRYSANGKAYNDDQCSCPSILPKGWYLWMAHFDTT